MVILSLPFRGGLSADGRMGFSHLGIPDVSVIPEVYSPSKNRSICISSEIFFSWDAESLIMSAAAVLEVICFLVAQDANITTIMREYTILFIRL